jgi:hypothetical protein
MPDSGDDSTPFPTNLTNFLNQSNLKQVRLKSEKQHAK